MVHQEQHVPRDGQPARDGLEHVYYVGRYYSETLLNR